MTKLFSHFISILSSHTKNPRKPLHPFTIHCWRGFQGEGYPSQPLHQVVHGREIRLDDRYHYKKRKFLNNYIFEKVKLTLKKVNLTFSKVNRVFGKISYGFSMKKPGMRSEKVIFGKTRPNKAITGRKIIFYGFWQTRRRYGLIGAYKCVCEEVNDRVNHNPSPLCLCFTDRYASFEGVEVKFKKPPLG